MRSVKTPLGVLLIVCLVTTAIFYACRKMEPSYGNSPNNADITRFLTTGPGTDTVVKVIAALVRRQHEQRGTIHKLIKNAGFALWDKAKVFRKGPGDGERLYIPFAKDDKQQTTAVLMVKIDGGDTLFHLLYPGHYDDYGFAQNDRRWNARDIFHVFTSFDYSIFGIKEFTVRDGRILGYQQKDIAPVKIKIDSVARGTASMRAQTVWEITEWVTYIHCGSCNQPARTTTVACCNATYETVMVTYWYDDGDDDWGWYTGFSNSETGGGSGPCPGCNWEDANPCDVEPPYENFCDPNWQPIANAQYNPLVYDSISVDPTILDSGYNCIYELLTEDIANINKRVQLTMYSIFGERLYTHLHFKMNWTGTCDSNYVMRTQFPGTRHYDLNNQLHFTDTVEINPCFAQNSSKELLIAAIVHESIHAYINWCIESYNRGQNGIDSFYLKEKFPLHFEKVMNRAYGNTAQHQMIVDGYVNEIKNAVIAGGNQTAPLSLREYIGIALAYHGLKATSKWNDLGAGQKCEYTGIQNWNQIYNQPSGWYYSISGCRNYDENFRDSLQLLGPCQ